MREIKFRAWSKIFKEDEMFYDVGLQIKEDGKWWTFNNNTRLYQSGDRVKIMQYTGLKDKNGKEIYEGDILQWEEDEVVKKGEMQWHQEHARFRIAIMSKMKVRPEMLEVIGNIYKNPELLK